MGKQDSFGPKALANKMKSVGLQKLRWYCQMCSKQCRDENGFKCHTQSEGHLRQMRLFADNSGRIINDFSGEFEKGFMQILSRHGSTRILANRVYQEYIQDKTHIHMNATRWSTLTGLCMYLGKEGKAIVEETDKGWFIQYVDRDPEKAAKLAEREERLLSEQQAEEENERMIEAQIEAAQRRLEERGEAGDEEDETRNELVRDEEDKAPISLGLKVNTGAALSVKKRLHSAFATGSDDDDDEDNDEGNKPRDKHATLGIKMPTFIPTSLVGRVSVAPPAPAPPAKESASSASAGMVQSNSIKPSSSSTGGSSSGGKNNDPDRRDYWLYTDMVVKIVNKQKKDGRYYRQKGVVTRVRDRYIAEVELLDSREVITLDQNDLQTYISDDSVGATVLVVNGVGRGYTAAIVKMFEDDCDVRINDRDAGSLRDKLLTRVSLDDVCSLKLRK